ncbi:hypothetical protein Tco_0753419 [Tanacetum coccineum]
MSSATSAVTYTSVYTDSEPDRAFWGADDEEISEGGIPRVIVLGYDGLPMQPELAPHHRLLTGPRGSQTSPLFLSFQLRSSAITSLIHYTAEVTGMLLSPDHEEDPEGRESRMMRQRKGSDDYLYGRGEMMRLMLTGIHHEMTLDGDDIPVSGTATLQWDDVCPTLGSRYGRGEETVGGGGGGLCFPRGLGSLNRIESSDSSGASNPL